MIENVNASKNPSTGEFVNYPKYLGVASINVLAVNPNNAKLRTFGWNIPDDAAEPNYILTDKEGKKSLRLRFLAQIQDFDEKPIITLDFFCRPEIMVNKENTKCKIIDQYGRTAWATKSELQSKSIPVYSDGNRANIGLPYKPCHYGEEELVAFLFKYLNITPLQIIDKVSKQWVPSKNPGKLTIDDWKALCSGDTKELAGYLAMQPDNRVKVILGVNTTADNKTYQSFLNTGYIGNGARVDATTGEYTTARKLIDKYYAGNQNSSYSYSASPVKEWKISASIVEESTPVPLFDSEGNLTEEAQHEELPF